MSLDEQTSGTRRSVTDPARLRALAHPIRIRLFDLFRDETEVLTATECGELIGESPASCSFHLRTLEKYGFVVRAPARGREKPWRIAAQSWDMRADPEVPGSLRAVQQVALLGVESEWTRVAEYFGQIERETDEWVQASTLTRSTFWATAEELAELGRRLQSLTAEFAGRSGDPGLRPPGARPARMVAVVNPEPVDEADRRRGRAG